MIPFPRRLAAVVLRAAVSIAPSDTLDWSRAMLGELPHVEGNWSAVLWSLGSAVVIAKHALIAIVVPSRNGSAISGEGPFIKEDPMRKRTLTFATVFVLASCLLFLTPMFRQAFRVSIAQWHEVLHVRSHSNPVLENIVREAEQNHDAEGLAFVSVRALSPPEGVRLADEAVHLDPKLTWVYGIVAVRQSSFPGLARWIPALKQYDPQNALPNLIAAENIDVEQVIHGSVPHRPEDRPAAWKDAMAAAFQSQKLDTYSTQLMELNRRVLLRYRIHDPFQALKNDPWSGLPTYTATDCSGYAKLLLDGAQMLEAKGDVNGASKSYFAVVQFGQIIGPGRRGWFFRGNLQSAYQRLEAQYARTGRKDLGEFFASLANQGGKSDQAEVVESGAVSRWNALLARASGVTMLSSAFLFVMCGLIVVLRGRSLALNSLQLNRTTLALGVGAATVFLLSTGLLYVSYKPYGEILQRFIQTGEDTRLPELSEFLAYTQVPLGVGRNMPVFQFVYNFWSVVLVLCLLVLLFAIWRFQQRPRASA
jgi:hypothetical protein